ncbi:MAG TPA: hypothetical protein VJ343_03430 [archaeon]|nr:hypothetical protein [archaeon]
MRIGFGSSFVLAIILISLIVLTFSPYSLFQKSILIVSLVTMLNAYLVYSLLKTLEKLTGHIFQIIKYTVWCMVCLLYLLTIQIILMMTFPQMNQAITSYQIQNFYIVLVVSSLALVVVYYSFILSISKEVKEFGKIYGFRVDKKDGKIRAKES